MLWKDILIEEPIYPFHQIWNHSYSHTLQEYDTVILVSSAGTDTHRVLHDMY